MTCRCSGPAETPVPKVLFSRADEATVRRRMRCTTCDRRWWQIEVRVDGEVEER